MSCESDWISFFPGLFLTGTTELTNVELGVYIRLLCQQHQRGGLPDDLAKLDRIVPGARRAWPALEAKFTRCDDGLLRNERMAKECEAARARISKARRAGEEGNRKRWGCQARPSDRSGDRSSDRSSDPPAIAGATLTRSQADRYDRTEQYKHPLPPVGGGGGAGGETGGEADSAAATLRLAPARDWATVHPSAFKACVLRWGDDGRSKFDASIAKRLAVATAMLDAANVGSEHRAACAEALVAKPWDEFDRRIEAARSGLAQATSPTGWLLAHLGLNRREAV